MAIQALTAGQNQPLASRICTVECSARAAVWFAQNPNPIADKVRLTISRTVAHAHHGLRAGAPHIPDRRGGDLLPRGIGGPPLPLTGGARRKASGRFRRPAISPRFSWSRADDPWPGSHTSRHRYAP